jgi:alkylation response protein AidB-like acyl-CoA dehydrogenase
MSERQCYWRDRVVAFMARYVYPAIPVYDEQMERFGSNRWQVVPILEELKKKAKAEGLWNLHLPPSPEHDEDDFHSAGLSILEYAMCSEEMGKISFGSEVFNRSAPDTGNMEVLHRCGSRAQKKQWLRPLMNGEIRSAFLMTRAGRRLLRRDQYRDLDSALRRSLRDRRMQMVVVGCRRPSLQARDRDGQEQSRRCLQQLQILVSLDAPGIKVVRMLPVFGFDDGPHGHADVILDKVRVPTENLIIGEGRGFEIAQGRLGPRRIHHCMRTIGVAEAALEKMVRRLLSRVAFSKRISEQSVWEQRIAEARIDIEMTSLLCLKAADMMDKVGNKAAKLEIAMIKVAAPRVALKVIDDAIQAHSGGGVTTDFGLAKSYAGIRTLRLADGPDEVHNRQIARLEMRKYTNQEQSA